MNLPLPKILIIDDEPRVVDVLTLMLQDAGYQPVVAYNGKDGLRTMYAEQPDLILLDIMMPEMDGFAVLDQLRYFTDLPVILLTAAAHDANRIRGMNKGAVDIVAKGGSTQVLLANIQNRLDARAKHDKPQGPRVLSDMVQLDLPRRMLRVEGAIVNLTPLQWKLLQCLVERERKVTKYIELLVAGWENPDFRDMRAVKVQISQLRSKLRDSARHSHYIHNIREEGYMFDVR